MAVNERKKLIKLCDKEMSLYVRERDKKCVLCGSTKNLQCGHLMSRVAHSTRWSYANCFCQCSGCNLKHEFNPHPFIVWYVKTFGWNVYEALLYAHSHTMKFSKSDLVELLADIKRKREAL